MGARFDIVKNLSSLNDEFSSWGDVLAQCYCGLVEAAKVESRFIAHYYSSNPAGIDNNPNIDALRSVEQAVRKAVCRNLDGEITLYEAQAIVFESLHEAEIVPFGDGDEANVVSPLWAVIKGIDGAYASSDITDGIRMRGPLNKMHQDEVGVYLGPSIKAPLREAYADARNRRVPGGSFNEQLCTIAFYRRLDGRDLPRIVVVEPPCHRDVQSDHPTLDALCAEIPEDGGDEYKSTRRVRIGLELFTGVQLIESGDSPIVVTPTVGSGFAIRYRPDYASFAQSIVQESIVRAIEASVDVLVFPELVVSPALRDFIGECLRTPECRGRLSLVVAGSGWCQGVAGGSNNVCTLFDGYGSVAGVYFKHEPYLEHLNVDGIDLYEDLANPGFKCTVVDVPAVGRVLPSICKDLVSEERYTVGLAKAFEPDLVCVPALSRSLDKAFEDQMDSLARRSFATTCVCNLCGARRGKRDSTHVSIVGHPVPAEDNPTYVRCKTVYISRTPSCLQRCQECFGRGAMRSCLNVVSLESKSFGGGTTLSVEESLSKRIKCE